MSTEGLGSGPGTHRAGGRGMFPSAVGPGHPVRRIPPLVGDRRVEPVFLPPRVGIDVIKPCGRLCLSLRDGPLGSPGVRRSRCGQAWQYVFLESRSASW